MACIIFLFNSSAIELPTPCPGNIGYAEAGLSAPGQNLIARMARWLAAWVLSVGSDSATYESCGPGSLSASVTSSEKGFNESANLLVISLS